MKTQSLIRGGSYTDHRGTVRFLNDFDMAAVRRFYTITHDDTFTRRGWRGHQIEQRWFYAIKGSFELEIVEIDDWNLPDEELPILLTVISAEKNEVIHLPAGFATCLRALEPDSVVVLFSDYGIENAKFDDHLWPNNYFKNKL
ncbi:MAG: hypothetical protein EOP04_12425 [Proteobacteria bacterium]|nr:MAG: hypothetical protein EOP04_12425 [Pseudomonadota bacterium]